MPRGGARPGAGRKARDRPAEPLLTYSLTLRPTDVGYLNQFGRGNLSLGLRRLIDEARTHLVARPIERAVAGDPPILTPPLAHPVSHAEPIIGHKKGTTEYG